MKVLLSNVEVIRSFHGSQNYGRPEIDRKLLKLLWFVLNEGLCLTINKVVSARLYRTMLNNGQWVLFKDAKNIHRLGIIFKESVYFDEYRIISDNTLDTLISIDKSQKDISNITYSFHKEHKLGITSK